MNKTLKTQRLYPNAKLNLYLEIIRQKPDGYHLLETIMVPISLNDEIHITLYDEGDITVKTSNSDIPQSENIIYKILTKAKKKFNLKFGARVIVKKYIPSGAGLGGGSSDGAFVLKFLNEVLNFASMEELITFSAEIGADIPFFLINKPAFCEGIGEIITPISVPKSSYYLFTPDYHVNTAKIFQNRAKFISENELFGKSISKYKDNLWNFLQENDLLFFNRLSDSVKAIEPKLFNIIEKKFNEEMYLTGSGSTFYTNVPNQNLIKVNIL